jgi:hypothetical protein
MLRVCACLTPHLTHADAVVRLPMHATALPVLPPMSESVSRQNHGACGTRARDGVTYGYRCSSETTTGACAQSAWAGTSGQ